MTCILVVSSNFINLSPCNIFFYLFHLLVSFFFLSCLPNAERLHTRILVYSTNGFHAISTFKTSHDHVLSFDKSTPNSSIPMVILLFFNFFFLLVLSCNHDFHFFSAIIIVIFLKLFLQEKKRTI